MVDELRDVVGERMKESSAANRAAQRMYLHYKRCC